MIKMTVLQINTNDTNLRARLETEYDNVHKDFDAGFIRSIPDGQSASDMSFELLFLEDLIKEAGRTKFQTLWTEVKTLYQSDAITVSPQYFENFKRSVEDVLDEIDEEGVPQIPKNESVEDKKTAVVEAFDKLNAWFRPNNPLKIEFPEEPNYLFRNYQDQPMYLPYGGVHAKTIYFPQKTLETDSKEDLVAVLCHEFAHFLFIIEGIGSSIMSDHSSHIQIDQIACILLLALGEDPGNILHMRHLLSYKMFYQGAYLYSNKLSEWLVDLENVAAKYVEMVRLFQQGKKEEAVSLARELSAKMYLFNYEPIIMYLKDGYYLVAESNSSRGSVSLKFTSIDSPPVVPMGYIEALEEALR